MQCNRHTAKIVLVWFVKEVAMATRYAEKYRRSPYPQAARIPVNTFDFLRHLSLRGTCWYPSRTKFSSLLRERGRQILLGGGDMSSPSPLLRTLMGGCINEFQTASSENVYLKFSH